MRFMVIVKASPDSEAGKLPPPELLEEMGTFNEAMANAGVMRAGDGLQPSSKGTRIRFSGTQRTVIDGPFTETEQLVAGFWIVETRSKDETIEWMKRAPFQGGEVEIRQIYEMDDFAGVITDDARALHERVRAGLEHTPS